MLAPFPLQQFSLALKFKDVSALTAIFNNFQGFDCLFENSRTFKVCADPVHKCSVLLELVSHAVLILVFCVKT